MINDLLSPINYGLIFLKSAGKIEKQQEIMNETEENLFEAVDFYSF